MRFTPISDPSDTPIVISADRGSVMALAARRYADSIFVAVSYKDRAVCIYQVDRKTRVVKEIFLTNGESWSST